MRLLDIVSELVRGDKSYATGHEADRVERIHFMQPLGILASNPAS